MIGLIIIGILLLVGAAVGSYYVSVGLRKGNFAKVAAYCAAVLVLGLGFLFGLQMIAAGGAVEGLKNRYPGKLSTMTGNFYDTTKMIF